MSSITSWVDISLSGKEHRAEKPDAGKLWISICMEREQRKIPPWIPSNLYLFHLRPGICSGGAGPPLVGTTIIQDSRDVEIIHEIRKAS